MPELPEVETIARELRPLVVGQIITDAWFDWPNQIKHPAPSAFAGAVRGREIVSVERRAKWLIFSLGPALATGEPAVLAIQVKMTGQLDVVPRDAPRDKHVHVVLGLDDGRELRLRDTRKFGRVALYTAHEADAVLGALGPEPLGEAFSLREFRRLLRARRARLKTLLMDQAFLAGVGNIYADEALWRARLHPLRTADSLSEAEVRRLHRAVRSVLRQGIANRGSSISDYVGADGEPGDNAEQLAVYRRTGEPCLRCGREIARIVIGQRSTHFCPRCQREPLSAGEPSR